MLFPSLLMHIIVPSEIHSLPMPTLVAVPAYSQSPHRGEIGEDRPFFFSPPPPGGLTQIPSLQPAFPPPGPHCQRSRAMEEVGSPPLWNSRGERDRSPGHINKGAPPPAGAGGRGGEGGRGRRERGPVPPYRLAAAAQQTEAL